MTPAQRAQYDRDRADAGQEIADENLKLRREAIRQKSRVEGILRRFDGEVQSEDFGLYLRERKLQLCERWPASPVDRGAEMAALGAMLVEPTAAEIVFRRLRPPHLHYEVHRLIFLAAATVNQRSRQNRGPMLDYVTVASELKNQRQFDVLPSNGYLVVLVDSCPSTANVEAYIDAILEAARLRYLFRLGEHITKAALAPGANSLQLLNSLRNAATEIEQKGCVDTKTHFMDYK